MPGRYLWNGPKKLSFEDDSIAPLLTQGMVECDTTSHTTFPHHPFILFECEICAEQQHDVEKFSSMGEAKGKQAVERRCQSSQSSVECDVGRDPLFALSVQMEEQGEPDKSSHGVALLCDSASFSLLSAVPNSVYQASQMQEAGEGEDVSNCLVPDSLKTDSSKPDDLTEAIAMLGDSIYACVVILKMLSIICCLSFIMRRRAVMPLKRLWQKTL